MNNLLVLFFIGIFAVGDPSLSSSPSSPVWLAHDSYVLAMVGLHPGKIIL